MAIRRPTLRGVLAGGLLAGTIDIGSASVINRVDPVFILHAIASGVYGRPSFSGGAPTAAAGFLLQWLISLVIALIYAAITTRLSWFRRHWVVGGFVAGPVIFAVMNYVVVPLSAVHRFPHFSAEKLAGNLAALILFGLIVAYFARDRPDPGALITEARPIR